MIYSLKSEEGGLLIDVDRNRTVRKWRSPGTRRYRGAFFTGSTRTLMLVVYAFAWYNKGELKNKNRKYYFSSTKAESRGENTRGLHGSWQVENNLREKDRRGVRGGGE